MITQAIRDWLHKMFAWWPWKQSPSSEYQHVASAVTSGPAPETSLWVSRDGTVPQAGATPRRFTLENRGERLAHPRAETPDVLPISTPVAFLHTEMNADELEGNSPNTPTPQQRLEFLRYLVQRGIVNEGFDQ